MTQKDSPSRVSALLASCVLVLLIGPSQHSSAQNPSNDRQLGRDQSSRKCIALVIGNGAYTNAPPLKNPPNDAADMAAALKELDFEVISGINQSRSDIIRLIHQFGERLKSRGTVGLFYYAGHGIQVNGKNYLIPTDAAIRSENEVELEAVDVSRVLVEMEDANNPLNIVILDACRNNPFSRSWRSSSEGLASINAPSGTLIAYSTAPGKVAEDGTGRRNAPYTAALLKAIRIPDLSLPEVFIQVRTDVQRATNGQQTPWEASSLTGRFYFKRTPQTEAASATATQIAPIPKPTPLPTPTPVATVQGTNVEESYWQIVSNNNTQSGYENYRAEYPSGKYVTDAKNRIAKFKEDEIARQKSIERSKWREAEGLNTTEAYTSYLTEYPNGEFVSDARTGIRTLQNKAEQTKWQEARNLDTKDSYNAYLTSYPDGAFVTEARSGVKAIEARDDQAKWDEVQILNRKNAFQSYLAAFPTGKYAGAAREKIREFEAEDARRLKEQQKAIELSKWEEAERLKTIDAYDGYLSAYPNGAYANLARLRLSNMGIIRSPIEETDWQEISKRNTRPDYELYLSKYPDGKYASNAKEKIKGFEDVEARALRERERTRELEALRGKTTIATGHIDLKTWGESFDRGGKVVFKIKYDVEYFSANLMNGTVTVSKDLVSFQFLDGSQGFSVSPDKILMIIDEQPLRLRLKVGIKRGKKEDQKEFAFFHPSASKFLTRKNVLGGLLNPLVPQYKCDRCDESLAVLIGFLQASKETH